MSKLRAPLLTAILLFCGCSHHAPVNQPAAAVAPHGDSALTGLPPQQPYDAFVHAPPASPVPVAQPVAPVASTVPVTTGETGAPATPADAPDASSMAAGAPADPAPVPDISSPGTSAPAMNSSDSENGADAGRLSLNANAPAAATDGTPAPESNNQVVVLQTSKGQIVIELDDFAAPKTCKNFRELITDGFYNHTVFHRVIPGFIIQGGDPKSKSSATDRNTYGLGSPGYTLPAEIRLKHDRGAVAMARLPDSVNPQRESNGSQFYICLAPAPSLDDQYTVFGHVVKGLDVADQIANETRDQRDNPLQRTEMMVSLQDKDQALQNSSADNQ